MLLPPKYCPSCAAEHVHTALRCLDCDVPLELHPPGHPGSAAAPERSLPPAEQLPCLVRGDPFRIERLALYLQEAGLSSRVDSYPPGRQLGSGGMLSFGGDTQVGIYVHPDEREQGMRLIEEYDAGRMPEPEASEVEGCPACGGALSTDASSCSSCGLEFPVERFECTVCRAAVPDEATTCPGCGATIDGESLHAEGRENHGE